MWLSSIISTATTAKWRACYYPTSRVIFLLDSIFVVAQRNYIGFISEMRWPSDILMRLGWLKKWRIHPFCDKGDPTQNKWSSLFFFFIASRASQEKPTSFLSVNSMLLEMKFTSPRRKTISGKWSTAFDFIPGTTHVYRYNICSFLFYCLQRSPFHSTWILYDQ